MRDFPVFSTENGVGSLILKEIPYSGIAYVTIHDSSFPTEFIKECTEFCRAVGAQTVYASGHTELASFPVHTSVIRMAATVDCLPDTDACLFPVTERTINSWREIYNNRMKNIHNAAFMSDSAAREMLKRGDGYFVHRDGDLLGIGIASGERIDCVASVKPGSGREVVLALAHALICERVFLDVASTNLRAVRLYESIGFIQTKEISKWYKIF